MTRLLSLVAAVVAVLASTAAGAEERLATDMPAARTGCPAPQNLLAIRPMLARVAARLETSAKLTIVAVGSSSTEGIGASNPALTYPSRLEAELRRRFPQVDVRVINRGKRGEDAPEELARLEQDVLVENPDLVIWQIGTNAMLRRLDPEAEREAIRRGIAMLKRSSADVVLMDMQYAPAVVSRPSYPAMQQLIEDVAERNQVGLFRRFELMRQWAAEQPPETAPAVGPDGLHLTDRGYACLAVNLADAIVGNWRRHQREFRHRAAGWLGAELGFALAGGGDP